MGFERQLGHGLGEVTLVVAVVSAGKTVSRNQETKKRDRRLLGRVETKVAEIEIAITSSLAVCLRALSASARRRSPTSTSSSNSV